MSTSFSNLKLWTPDPTVRSPLPLRIVNACSIVVVFAINAVATSGALGQSTGELSGLYPVLITPAGYAFSIWGLIYALLAAFMIYQLLPFTYTSRPVNEAITFLIPINAVMNVGWLFAWHYQTPNILGLSLVFMLGLWLSLVTIYYRLSRFTPAKDYIEYICVHLPFSLYLGWINVASMLNLFIVAGVYAKPGSSEADMLLYQNLSVAALIFLAVAVLVLSLIRRDPAVAFVFTWAAIGIWSEGSNATIDTLSLVAAATVAAFAAAIWALNLYDIRRHTRVAAWHTSSQQQQQQPRHHNLRLPSGSSSSLQA